ncbi:hypothetical protein X757_32410 [Mesorhizobium sp. LSHC414A00]|nr:hypothetical protein X757_32410 [Mesorhizobium sp. LSHC414A00]
MSVARLTCYASVPSHPPLSSRGEIGSFEAQLTFTMFEIGESC